MHGSYDQCVHRVRYGDNPPSDYGDATAQHVFECAVRFSRSSFTFLHLDFDHDGVCVCVYVCVCVSSLNGIWSQRESSSNDTHIQCKTSVGQGRDLIFRAYVQFKSVWYATAVTSVPDSLSYSGTYEDVAL